MLNVLNLNNLVKLNRKDFEDKVHACWIGKNIGGTIGTPFEGTRELLDIDGFTTPENVVLPNDDLDLQLVWLEAFEQYGPNGLDAQKLGEYWMSYIAPTWSEYGICKANMSMGFPAPICGDIDNSWKDSNGAWIRTEVWACLAPGMPDTAIKYACMDACVDHGSGEGTPAAVFVAALESAAFVIKDLRTLIQIGLSKIPSDSRVAKSIKLVLDCYDGGDDWKTARNKVLKQNADIGDGWFEAPSNVAYSVIGLLYGEGDFKKTMLTAVNCGDDTDCTGATVGSVMGILGGTAIIPDDWKKHIGDEINTICIGGGRGMYNVPATCTELTAHIMRMAPVMLEMSRVFNENFSVEICDGETFIPDGIVDHFLLKNGIDGNRRILETRELLKRKPYTVATDFNYANAEVSYERKPSIKPCGTLKLSLRLKINERQYGNVPQRVCLRWVLPEGWSVEGPSDIMIPQCTSHTLEGAVYTDYTLTAGEKVDPNNRLILEIYNTSRPSTGLMSLIVLGE